MWRNPIPLRTARHPSPVSMRRRVSHSSNFRTSLAAPSSSSSSLATSRQLISSPDTSVRKSPVKRSSGVSSSGGGSRKLRTDDPETDLLSETQGRVRPVTCEHARFDVFHLYLVIIAVVEQRDDLGLGARRRAHLSHFVGLGVSLQVNLLYRELAYRAAGHFLWWTMGLGVKFHHDYNSPRCRLPDAGDDARTTVSFSVHRWQLTWLTPLSPFRLLLALDVPESLRGAWHQLTTAQAYRSLRDAGALPQARHEPSDDQS